MVGSFPVFRNRSELNGTTKSGTMNLALMSCAKFLWRGGPVSFLWICPLAPPGRYALLPDQLTRYAITFLTGCLTSNGYRAVALYKNTQTLPGALYMGGPGLNMVVGSNTFVRSKSANQVLPYQVRIGLPLPTSLSFRNLPSRYSRGVFRRDVGVISSAATVLPQTLHA